MSSDNRAVPDLRQIDRDRRRALALAAWSLGAAAAGVGTAWTRAPQQGPAPAGRVVLAGHRSTSSSAPTAHAGGPPASSRSVVAAPPTASPVDPSADASDGGGVDALVLHVARRTSFGPTPALLDEIRSAGVDGWLERQLSPSTIRDDDADDELAKLHDLTRTPAELRALGRQSDDVLADLRVAAVVRAVLSRRQLQEVMVDLWHDRLTASAAKAGVARHLPAYDRDSIRPHALGRFVDLLRAATRSGAMLVYLDTAASTAPDVNENHGRELLELHTVGSDAGMGEGDVAGAARVLSGWTIDPRTLTVHFDPTRHHAGPATVLGWSTPGRTGAAGAGDLDSLLQHLATHPATATSIATLLARRFVADDPPAELVASTAAAYLDAGTDLAATLRHLFGSSAFRSGGPPIVRRPFDLLAAQLRSSDARLDVPNLVDRLVPTPEETDATLQPVLDAVGGVDPVVEPLVRKVLPPRPIATSILHVLRQVGQALFTAPNPSGFAVAGRRWSSGGALLGRWTLGAQLAQDSLPGFAVDPVPLADGAATAGSAVDAIAMRCFGAAPSAATRAGALKVMGLGPGDPVDDSGRLRRALAFLLAAPEMQVR